MVFLSLLSALALGSAVSALPSLSVQVSGPSHVHGIDNFNITTTVTNDGGETLKVLNHPRGPLSDLPTDMFAITNQYGLNPDFVGISAKYLPAKALTSGHASAFTVLAPGESVVVNHPVSAAYDFSTSGPGQYIVTMKNLNTFYYADGDGVAALVAGSGRAFHVVDVHGSHSQIQASPNFDSGSCEAWQERAIQGAIPLAEKYVDNAVQVLVRDGSNSAGYKRWFGAISNNRFSTVLSNFEALDKNKYSEFAYACNARFCAGHPGVLAYVYPNRFGQIHICDEFFDAQVGGHNSRASTIVHEVCFAAFTGNHAIPRGPTILVRIGPRRR